MTATLHLKMGAVIPRILPMTKTLTKIPAGFHYRDSDHSYFMDGVRMTGCTTILGVLAKPALISWAAKMAVEHIEKNSVIYHSAEEMAGNDLMGYLEGKYAVSKETLEEAKTAHARKRDEGAQKGTDIHALVENYVKFIIITNEGYPIWDSVEQPFYEPIKDFIVWAMKEGIRFISSEQKLYSKSLFVAGTADLIFEKDGKRYIGDIKTFKKIWDRVPFYQCAGYSYMWEEMNEPSMPTEPSDVTPEEAKAYVFRSKIDGYCIINLPKERKFKEEDDIMWSFDTEGDTKAFLACVEIYRQNANFKPNYFKKS